MSDQTNGIPDELTGENPPTIPDATGDTTAVEEASVSTLFAHVHRKNQGLTEALGKYGVGLTRNDVVFVRLETLIELVVGDENEEFELAVAIRLNEQLQEAYDQATKPQLITP